MVNDNNINPIIYNIDMNFDFKDVIDNINNCVKGLKTYLCVTENNISKIFDYFILNIIKS